MEWRGRLLVSVFVVPRNSSRVSPLRIVLCPGERARSQETSATALETDPKREHERRRGISSSSPHFPSQPLFCFRSGHRNRNKRRPHFPFSTLNRKQINLSNLSRACHSDSRTVDATGRPNWAGNVWFPHMNLVDLLLAAPRLPTGRHDGSLLARCV